MTEFSERIKRRLKSYVENLMKIAKVGARQASLGQEFHSRGAAATENASSLVPTNLASDNSWILRRPFLVQ